MPAIVALETSLGPELAEFSRHLWAAGIPHRVLDEGEGRQRIVVLSAEHALRVRADFARWRAGELGAGESAPAPARSEGVLGTLRAVPVTTLLLLASFCGAALVETDGWLGWVHWLTFTDFAIVEGRLELEPVAETYARGQYWRLLTPVFLHFGLAHLVFNMLWVWVLGRQLERARGGGTLLAVLLIAGAGGNIAQYLTSGSVLFGGMSGVVYGLLGYLWIWTRLTGDPRTALPRGVFGFMLAWLLICMSGVLQAFGFGAIANAAHVAGLAFGALLGAGAALLYSRPRPPDV